jgi:DNA helicase II / ATP-dependent DNA helicase PcrA
MFSTVAWDEGLDEAQLTAATHGDGPVVVVAGAGTGKTRALVARVACLLERGVAPERVLLLTFTRRAADEMLARAAALVGLSGARRPYGGTFHAVAHRFIAAYAEPLGLAKGFSVVSPSEAADLMELMRPDYALTGTQERAPRSSTLVDIYSRCINTGKPLRDVLPIDFPWCQPHLAAIAELFAGFTQRKRQGGLLDFDDLLLYWRALLSEGALGAHLAGQFDYVLVDEYQDVNSLQVDIIRLLAPSGRGLTVVGDEAQAVYGFRGADSRHLRELVLELPDASMVRLEKNFRSRQAILDVANIVRPAGDGGAVRLFSDRGPGPRPRLARCHDAPAEARAIAESVLEAHVAGTPLCQQAVLVRASHHSDLLELELSARKIPYRKYGGLRFLEAAHVKDFVTAARLLDNPHDEVAWYRLLRLHDNLGPSRARALIDEVDIAGQDILDHWAQMVAAAAPQARSALSVTLSGLAGARVHEVSGQRAEAVLEVVRPLIVGRYPDAAVRLVDLERLVAAAGAVPDLAAWLAELTLDPPASSSNLAGPPDVDEDYLVISTIHSAKGLEWSVVHLPHVIDGVMPIDMALGTPEGLDEERRLFYVAITRARDQLYLYAPLRMPYHRRGSDDKHGYALISRFIDEKVTAILDVVEQPVERWGVPAGTAAEKVTVSLGELWG